MKKILYSILFVAGLGAALTSCSNGDYVANPASNGNNSLNPLNPLNASQFTWGGADPVSCNVNGAPWIADTAFYMMDTSGANVIWAYKGTQILTMYFANTWSGNVYNMGFKQYNVMASFFSNSDSMYSANFIYTSTLGNAGQMYMASNDTLHFTGKFYCQTVNVNGDIVNLSNGHFNVSKF